MKLQREIYEACSKCSGTGWYAYDHNHSKICEKCCTHPDGWWELTENHAGYKKNTDNSCCLKGCGTMKRDLDRTKMVLTEILE